MDTHLDTLIRDREVAELLGCSKSTVWRRVADGTLPPPVRLGGITRWSRSEIAAAIAEAKKARQEPLGADR